MIVSMVLRLDVLSHACLQEGARAATSNIHRFPHLSLDGVERRLRRIRKENQTSGIMVITESLFSMYSDVPDISALQSVCSQYDATLLVDAAHDLGVLGSTGRGNFETQNMVGKVDILMGAFSKSFASIGGFIACNEPALKIRLRTACGPSTFTNAMTPMQIGVLRKALEIIQSPEGGDRRTSLMRIILQMRTGLSERGFEVLGEPSPIIPVILGNSAISRLITRYANESVGFVNLVEYPAVSKNICRWRIQIMADHSADDIGKFLDIAVKARDWANEMVTSMSI